MWFCIFFGCIAVVIAQPQASRDVDRLAYGVYFEHKSDIKSHSQTWRQVFLIPLPNMELGSQYGMFDGSLQLKRGVNVSGDSGACLTYVARARTSVDRPNMPLCLMYKPLIETLMDTTAQAHMQIDELLHDIYALLPSEWSTANGTARRALLPFIGAGLKFLFGTSSDADVQILAKEVQTINSNQNTMLRELKKSVADMAAFATLDATRMTRMIAHVRAMSVHTLRLSEAHAAEEGRQLAYVVDIFKHMATIHHSSNLLLIHLSNYLEALELLRSGKLPVYLITPDILTTTLSNISTILENDFDSQLHVVYDTPQYYYTHAQFSYARSARYLIVTMQVPLSNIRTPFSVYALRTMPIPLGRSTQHLMTLTDIPDAIAINQDGNLMFTLTRDEMTVLLHSNTETNGRVYTRITTTNCIVAIFRADVMAVNVSCQYSVITNAVSHMVRHISDHMYALTAVPSYTLSCTNGSAPSVVTRHTGCEACTIVLGSSCTYDDGVFAIPPSGVLAARLNVTVRSHQPNLPLLAKFLDETKLNQIQARNSSLPLRIKLPPFNFFNSSYQDSIAADDKVVLQLNRVVQNVQNDGRVLADLSEGILDGSVHIPTQEFFLSAPGFVVEGLSAFVLLLFVIVMLQCYRLQGLAAAVAVLAKPLVVETLDIDYEDLVNAPQGGTSTETAAPATVMPGFAQADILKFMVQYEIYLNYATFAVIWIFVASLIYMYIRDLRRTASFGQLTTVYMKLVTQECAVTVKLCTLTGEMHDYKASAVNYVTHIRCEGYLFSPPYF